MEGRDGANALDLMEMAAGLGKRLAEQGLRRAITEQEQAPGLCEPNVIASDFSAGFALGGAHPDAGNVEAGK
jgi:hypothetical protein